MAEHFPVTCAGTNYRRLSDDALAARFGDCDEQALAEFVRRHGAAAHRLALRIVRDAFLAEDAVQEALLSAWESGSRFSPGRASARGWFLTIVHHRAVDVVRARERGSVEAPPARAIAAPDPLDATVERDAVRNALRRIPTEFRAPIALGYLCDLTQRQCAELLSEPLGTVKSQTFRGLACMRELVESHAACRLAEPRHTIGEPIGPHIANNGQEAAGKES
jgi:RNA polymerase sigma-70 factor (ECF subfamily)